MLNYLRLVMYSIGLSLAIGCSDASIPPRVQPGKPSPTVSSAADTDASPLASQSDINSDQTVSASPATAAAGNPPSLANHSVTAKDENPDKSTAERIAILTLGGPLLVDVRITIGGKPLATAFDSLIQRVMDAGDGDRDGKSTWKELTADRTFLEEEMPNAPDAGSRRMSTLIERYDENRDGLIQPGEAAAWLGRDAGASARPLAMRSTRAYRPAPRATSHIWHLIDVDSDGRLTRDEIAAATNRLLAFDADDDRVLAPTEVASLREQLEAAGQRRPYVARETRHHAALHLEADLDIERLNYLLTDLYAPRQDLGPSSFPDLSTAFKKLDGNGDGCFQAEELQSIRSIEPHMRMDVAFTETDGKNPGTASVEVKTLTPEVAVAARPAADRAVISLGGSRLIISAHALTARTESESNTGQKPLRNQARLMVHDQVDALFEELDASADGRLGEREIAFCSRRLAERDRNGDGQLSGDELPQTMIVAFVLGEAANESSFYVPPSSAVATTNDDQPMSLWFRHADLNGDGDVSRREFLGSAEQFNRLDSDKDGYIAVGETAL